MEQKSKHLQRSLNSFALSTETSHRTWPPISASAVNKYIQGLLWNKRTQKCLNQKIPAEFKWTHVFLVRQSALYITRWKVSHKMVETQTRDPDSIRQVQDAEWYYGAPVRILKLIGEWLAFISDTVLFKMYILVPCDKSWTSQRSIPMSGGWRSSKDSAEVSWN